MAFPNRELSQFASFLSINDSSANIGIAVTGIPFVGIGTSAPTQKLHVSNGNLKVDGDAYAVKYYGDGSSLTGVAAVITGNFLTSGGGIYTSLNVGIGTSSLTNALNVGGSIGVTSNVTAYRITSTAPVGIAPFTVQSTTQVNNLNAEFFQGRQPPSGNFVGHTDTQTLSNKTLINPGISTIVNGTALLTLPVTSGTLIHSNSVGIITSGVYGSNSINNSHIATNAGIVYTKLNLTNSIVNADINVGAGISYSKLNLANSIKSSDIDPNNRIANNKLVNSTISGIELGSNLPTLSRGTYITGSDYNGSSAVTWGIAASTDNVESTIVARDASGNIDASNIVKTSGNQNIAGTKNFTDNVVIQKELDAGLNSINDSIIRNTLRLTDNDGNNLILTNTSQNYNVRPADWLFTNTGGQLSDLRVSNQNDNRPPWANLFTFKGNGDFQVVTGTVITATSDDRLKKGIQPIENAVEKVNQLTGFTFEYNAKAIKLGFQAEKRYPGVSAQQVQNVLPEAVEPAPADNNYLTVRYEAIIPLLIEAIKEQSKELDTMKEILKNNGLL